MQRSHAFRRRSSSCVVMVEISCLTICNFCMSLYISYGRNDPRAKRTTGETTHLIKANRPTAKTRAKRPRAKRPGETTHGRNDPDSYTMIMAEAIRTTVVPIRILIRTTVVPIMPLIGTTVVRIRILIGTTGI